MKRKGLGKGLGRGYKNIVPRDPFIHGLSAKGVKTFNVPMKSSLSVIAKNKKEAIDKTIEYVDTTKISAVIIDKKVKKLDNYTAKGMERIGLVLDAKGKWEYWESMGGKNIEMLHFRDIEKDKEYIVEVHEGGFTRIINVNSAKYVYEGRNWDRALKELGVPKKLIEKSSGMKLDAKNRKHPFLLDSGQLIKKFDELVELGEQGKLKGDDLDYYYSLSNELTLRGKYKETKTYKEFLEQKHLDSYSMDAKGKEVKTVVGTYKNREIHKINKKYWAKHGQSWFYFNTMDKVKKFIDAVERGEPNPFI